MANLIVGGIIVLILGTSIGSIIQAKKKGIKCIGCDSGATCHKKQVGEKQAHGCGESCSHHQDNRCVGCHCK